MFVRHEVINLERSVVVQELEVAVNLAFCVAAMLSSFFSLLQMFS